MTKFIRLMLGVLSYTTTPSLKINFQVRKRNSFGVKTCKRLWSLLEYE